MLGRVGDEGDGGAAGDRRGDEARVVRLRGGVGDEDVGEALGGEEAGLGGGEGHDPAHRRRRRGRAMARSRADAADRLGGDPHRLAGGAHGGDEGVDVALERVEIDGRGGERLGAQGVAVAGVEAGPFSIARIDRRRPRSARVGVPCEEARQEADVLRASAGRSGRPPRARPRCRRWGSA